VINNVPTILTEMRSDANGTPSFRSESGSNGIRLDIDRGRIAGIASLSHGGNMVNIHAQECGHREEIIL
jgi:hypothetical protein